MSDGSTIQQARDVLAKWRSAAVPGRWASNDDSYLVEAEAEWGARFGDLGGSVESIPLIVGTAGNPDLLDALDEGLRQCGTMPERSVPTFIKRIAAAVIIADERMTSAD